MSDNTADQELQQSRNPESTHIAAAVAVESTSPIVVSPTPAEIRAAKQPREREAILQRFVDANRNAAPGTKANIIVTLVDSGQMGAGQYEDFAILAGVSLDITGNTSGFGRQKPSAAAISPKTTFNPGPNDDDSDHNDKTDDDDEGQGEDGKDNTNNNTHHNNHDDDYEDPDEHNFLGNRVWICCGTCHVSVDYQISYLVAFGVFLGLALLPTSLVDFEEAARQGSGVLAAWITIVAFEELLGIGVLINLVLAVCVEPGIVLPRSYYTSSEERKKMLKEFGGTIELPEKPEDTRSIEVQLDESKPDQLTAIKWEQAACPVCGIWRPPRSSHDWADDVCVRGYDHHCQILGCGVGERNFRFFYLFNLLLTLAGLFMFVIVGCAFRFLIFWDRVANSALEAWRVASGILLIVLCIIAVFMTVSFTWRYTYFACHNVTAKDVMGWRSTALVLAKAQRKCPDSNCGECCSRVCGPVAESTMPY